MSPTPAASLVAKRSSVPGDEISTSSVTLGEIIYGAYRVPDRAAGFIERLDSLLSGVVVLPFDADAARRYGELRADLDRRGGPMGDADTRIAAIALTRRLTVVTANVRHFRRVPGLAVENWLV